MREGATTVGGFSEPINEASKRIESIIDARRDAQNQLQNTDLPPAERRILERKIGSMTHNLKELARKTFL